MNTEWFKPEVSFGRISNIDIHDSEFVGIDLENDGTMSLRFRIALGGFILIGIYRDAQPKLIGFSHVIPMNVACASIRLVSEDLAQFQGIFSETDLRELNGTIKDFGSPYDWLLILEPNLGDTVVAAGKGTFESMVFCAVAERLDLLPSTNKMPVNSS